jgi:hypothetical protein
VQKNVGSLTIRHSIPPSHLQVDKGIIGNRLVGNTISLLVLKGGRWSAREVGITETSLRGRLGGRRSVANGVGLWRGRAAADETLSLGRVVTHVLLGELGDVGRVLAGSASDLGSLGADNLGGVLELSIDELLVRSVNERKHKGSSGSDDGKAPVGNNLDEVVRDESGDESLSCVSARAQAI